MLLGMTRQIPCQTCGEMFTPRTSGGKPQVRCSEKCRRAVANANYIKAHAPVKAVACAECGEPIVHLETGRPRKFCSDECKARVSNRAANRRRLPVSKQPERNCAHCGRVFQPGRRDQVYCKASCATNAGHMRRYHGAAPRQGVEFNLQCVECGNSFTALKANAKWCSPICRIRTNGRDASRRRGPGEGAVPYTDREIFERDNWICQLCFSRVDPTVPRRDPEGATIDHTIPLIRGGIDAPSNVVTAHWRCNREKWSR